MECVTVHQQKKMTSYCCQTSDDDVMRPLCLVCGYSVHIIRDSPSWHSVRRWLNKMESNWTRLRYRSTVNIWHEAAAELQIFDKSLQKGNVETHNIGAKKQQNGMGMCYLFAVSGLAYIFCVRPSFSHFGFIVCESNIIMWHEGKTVNMVTIEN